MGLKELPARRDEAAWRSEKSSVVVAVLEDCEMSSARASIAATGMAVDCRY